MPAATAGRSKSGGQERHKDHVATPKPSPRLKPRPGDRRGPLGARPGSSLWYGLVFLLLLVLVQAYYMTPTGKSLPYSEFKDLVKKGAVSEVTVGDQLI